MGITLVLLVIFHLILSVALIAVVLMQSDKGEGLAGAFGGGASSAVFGSRGPASFLSRLTAILAVIFMFSSIGITYLASKEASQSESLQNITSAAGTPLPISAPIIPQEGDN